MTNRAYIKQINEKYKFPGPWTTVVKFVAGLYLSTISTCNPYD